MKTQSTLDEDPVSTDKSTLDEDPVSTDKSTLDEDPVSTDKSTLDEDPVSTDKSTLDEDQVSTMTSQVISEIHESYDPSCQQCILNAFVHIMFGGDQYTYDSIQYAMNKAMGLWPGCPGPSSQSALLPDGTQSVQLVMNVCNMLI